MRVQWKGSVMGIQYTYSRRGNVCYGLLNTMNAWSLNPAMVGHNHIKANDKRSHYVQTSLSPYLPTSLPTSIPFLLFPLSP